MAVIRTYYRLSLTILCALAAYVGPVLFLRYPYNLGFFAGGLAAAFIAWGLLVAVIAIEPDVDPGVQFILGAGAGVLSWAYPSFVAAFHVLPLIVQNGWRLNDIFDPVWLMGGFSPLLVLLIAGWISHTTGKLLWHAVASALFRFSIPLAVLVLLPRVIGLPRQYRWLFLFTGVMFLILDGLGIGRAQPSNSLSRQGERR